MKVLVTGGSSDIAFAIVKRRVAMGDSVTITASNSSSLETALKKYSNEGIAVDGFVFDFANPQASSTWIEEKISNGIDAVVFNAFEKVRKIARFHELTFEDGFRYVHENLEGNFWLIHRVLPSMIQRRFGRLVLISSISAAAGTSGYGVYCSSKAALEGLFQNLAVDYASDGILSNIVRLGLFKTSRTALFWKRSEYLSRVSQIIPQRVLGEPNQAAEALDPLLSSSSYMNGSILAVSGGLPLSSFGGVK